VDEMAGLCGRHMGGGNSIEFWWENLKERDYVEDLGVDGRIMLT